MPRQAFHFASVSVVMEVVGLGQKPILDVARRKLKITYILLATAEHVHEHSLIVRAALLVS